MSTLATLKADIADDLARSDLTSAIASEISRAIKFYQPQRFWFNETRDLTFDTVADQPRYAGADDADIPLFYALDGMFVTDGTSEYELDTVDVRAFEVLSGSSSTSSRPYAYCRFNVGFGLYPTPDAAYTIRPMGHYKLAGPASDDEANNAWMVEAYDLIRRRALHKVVTSKRVLEAIEVVPFLRGEEQEEFNRLKDETSRRTGIGFIMPSQF
ncbi:hypothetical protein [Roseibium sp.]|uniref:phage adaptor protein n=1 Tax=Roseibium sp. TaxID=1936156 RepID=UPI003288C580